MSHPLPAESSHHVMMESPHHVLSRLYPVLRVSDNVLQYLFANYEAQNTVFDGAMVLTGVASSSTLVTGGHLPYLRDYVDADDLGAFTIHLKIDQVAGVWTLTIADGVSAPFYTGTNPDGPFGDYSGTGNPFDPVTLIKNVPWLVAADNTFWTWLKASDITLGGLPDAMTFTDPITFLGNQAYADYEFDASAGVLSTVRLQHLAPVAHGPSNWYFTGGPGSLQYTRRAGDGPSPYGIYDRTTYIGGGSPPLTMTISAASVDAPNP